MIKLSGVNKQLIEIIKQIQGKLIVIGSIDESVKDAIEQCPNINQVDLLIDNSKLKPDKFKFQNKKTIYIKKLKKHYGKKRVDYIIANYDDVKYKFSNFVVNSTFITKKEVYIFSTLKQLNIEQLAKQFNYFNAETSLVKTDNHLIRVNTIETNNSKINELKYYLNDISYKLFQYISNFLTN